MREGCGAAMTRPVAAASVTEARGFTTSEERERERSRRARSLVVTDRRVRWAAVAGLVWVLGYAAAAAATGRSGRGHDALADGAYLVPIAVAAAMTGWAALRARTRRARRFWLLLAASNALWLAGEVTWSAYVFVLRRDVPFPSLADGFYLCSYVLVLPAIALGFGGTFRSRPWRSLLDASLMVVAVGMAGWIWLIEPQLAWGASLATATGIAYPLLGVAIMMMLGTLAFGSHRDVPLSIPLVAFAFAVSAATDSAYTFSVVLHDYVSDQWLNVGWQLEAVLLALAPLVVVSHDEGEAKEQRVARDLGLPLVLGGLALTVALTLVDTRSGELRPRNLALLGFAAMVVFLRLILTARERGRLARRLEGALDEQRRLAVSDGLTGLFNRRFFEELLTIEVERARRNGGQVGLLVIDVDHFKRINDRYGHQGGDRVLAELAKRLRGTVRDLDVVARYGGEEFVIVFPEQDPELLPEFAERCRLAICRLPYRLPDGREIEVTASVGAASFPDHGLDAERLVRVADAALYRAKERGRDRIEIGESAESHDVDLLGGSVFAYLEQVADLIDNRETGTAHSLDTARLASQVAEALGLDEQRRWRCVAAARLHDIGKIAVPTAILYKREPLSADEWDLIKLHPVHGSALLARAPELADIAHIVREHHEWFDGTGYPDRKRDEEISLEARILAVCDAWSAMSSERPYRPALTEAEAAAELERAAGSQFDPRSSPPSSGSARTLATTHGARSSCVLARSSGP
jgi:two-component system cell cycle response regulator